MRPHINRSVAVLGTGRYLPERVVSNEALRDLCTTYDESVSGDFSTWVDRVTHVHERRFIADGETAGHMGARAAEDALEMAGVRPQELDLIIHASFTPSNAVPGDHVVMADLLGAKSTPSYTLMGACAGAIYGMGMAYGMLASGAMRRILVVGSETISPTLDFSDPLTAILFGDGAGAVVMGAVEGQEGGFMPPVLGFEFNWENIQMGNANLSFGTKVRIPAAEGTPAAVEQPSLTMIGGQSVLKNAILKMADCVRRVLGGPGGEISKAEMAEIQERLRVVPHQANGRIVDGLARKLCLDARRMTKTIFTYANVSAASNLMALDYAVRKGNMTAECDPETEQILAIHEVKNPIQKGDIVVLPSIGAGYVYGAVGFVHSI
jgi:3-oxoacyl-[acyl-carrier-protein] synthase-3